jgi:photosystem II stability/assembly factor-like uncharacterized protein
MTNLAGGTTPDPAFGYDRLRWRPVGPARGGRSVAISGDPRDRLTFWMGACAGGVWRTTDAGRYWRPMGDGQLGSASVGAIAVAPSDPNVVWVGTGESQVRNNVVPGDGVYRTTDAGRSWQHVGLAETRHISRVRVHPQDPDVAWVGALGDIFGPSEDRGVFRTRDGGLSWERVLHVSDSAGCADLAPDPTNPRVLYAAIWEAVRRPWEMVSGGDDSGLWRSDDGGDSWTRVSDRPGFAAGPLGRMGVTVSGARAGRVWALVEATEGAGGVYRSDDHGMTWGKVSSHRGVQGRPFYFSHVFAHPTRPDTVYSMNLWAWRSDDGGANWTQVQTPHCDNHDLWIDPHDPDRMGNASDGGAAVSLDGGYAWSDTYNQQTAQIYRFDVDPRFPHDLYGTQQDNSGIRVPSRSWKGGIRWTDCTEVGEAEAGDVAIDPLDPRFVFLGGAGYGHSGPLIRVDQATQRAQNVSVWPEYFLGSGASTHTHRFGWTFPITFSPHDPSVLYTAAERVFRSRDRGLSWEAISGDLTRDDETKQLASGGPISKDTSGAEVYCTIHAFAESPLTPGELWTGSDDGLVHCSRDGGRTWTDVTPPTLPMWATVQRIEPSRHTPGTAYLAAHAYRLQDRSPYLFVTRDHGASWQRIVDGIHADEWTRTIREDPESARVLYAGTERRPYASVDGGGTWFAIGAGLPVVPISDLQVVGSELVAGTHGRGFWILDDVGPIRALPDSLGDDELVTFPPAVVHTYPTPDGFDVPGEGVWPGAYPGVPLGGAAITRERRPDGSEETVFLIGGKNPPNGVALRYLIGPELANSPADAVGLAILDDQGVSVATFRAVQPGDGLELESAALVATQAGLNVFVWDLRADGAVSMPDSQGRRRIVFPGPRVPPGRYRADLTIGSCHGSFSITVLPDPRSVNGEEEQRAQYRYLCRARELVARIHRALEQASQVDQALGRLLMDAASDAELTAELSAVRGRIDGLQRRLTNPDIRDHESPVNDQADALKLPGGIDHAVILLREAVLELSDGPPNDGAEAVLTQLEADAEAALSELRTVFATTLPSLSEAIAARGALQLWPSGVTSW